MISKMVEDNFVTSGADFVSEVNETWKVAWVDEMYPRFPHSAQNVQ